MKSDANRLQQGVGSIPGRGVLDVAFDLIDECLNRLVVEIRCAKFGVVVSQVGRQNIGVGCVQMFQYGAGGGGAVAYKVVAEGMDKHFIDGSD